MGIVIVHILQYYLYCYNYYAEIQVDDVERQVVESC